MNNFELRWLERKTGERGMDEYGNIYDETVRVLQYRQKYDKTIYSGLGPHGDFLKQIELVWSDWMDVPKVTET